MRHHLTAWTAAAIAAACPTARTALAQGPPPTSAASRWVGRRIVTPFGTLLHDGGAAVVDDLHARELAMAGHGRQEFRVYRVERAEGDRLWVASEGGASRGWITAVEAIPLERAVEHYTARIAVNPSDANNYANRSAIWDVLGDFDRALLDDTEAIRLDPDNAMAYHNRGLTWAHKKDLGRAIDDFTQAIRIDPKYARAYNKRGCAWLEKKSYARAVADFTEAIRIDPKFGRAYHNRGNAMVRQKDYDRAIADYTAALKVDPSDILAFVDRSAAYRGKGDDVRALADLSRALLLRPDSPEALVGRAWLLATSPSAKIRDGKRALDDAARACELTHWKEAYPLGTLAAAAAERGDFDSAVKYQQRAQALYKAPDDIAKGHARLDLYKAKAPYREPSPSDLARPEGKAPAPPAMGHAVPRPDHPDRPAPGGRGV